METDRERILAKRAFICDMDGVVYHGNQLLPGVPAFVDWLQREELPFLFLTNSSERAPRELAAKLERLGIRVGEEHFHTSALATAAFLGSQRPGGSAYVIGEAGLINALYDVGYTMNDVDPDYVVVGESRSYSYEKIERAIHLVLGGGLVIQRRREHELVAADRELRIRVRGERVGRHLARGVGGDLGNDGSDGSILAHRAGGQDDGRRRSDLQNVGHRDREGLLVSTGWIGCPDRNVVGLCRLVIEWFIEYELIAIFYSEYGHGGPLYESEDYLGIIRGDDGDNRTDLRVLLD